MPPCRVHRSQVLADEPQADDRLRRGLSPAERHSAAPRHRAPPTRQPLRLDNVEPEAQPVTSRATRQPKPLSPRFRNRAQTRHTTTGAATTSVYRARTHLVVRPLGFPPRTCGSRVRSTRRTSDVTSLTCGCVSDFVSPVASVSPVPWSYAFGYARARTRPTMCESGPTRSSGAPGKGQRASLSDLADELGKVLIFGRMWVCRRVGSSGRNVWVANVQSGQRAVTSSRSRDSAR